MNGKLFGVGALAVLLSAAAAAASTACMVGASRLHGVELLRPHFALGRAVRTQ